MLKVIDKIVIKKIISETKTSELLDYIEKAFTAYSENIAVVPPVGTLRFDDPRGDVHIKYGFIKGDDYYVIKIASGFYDNPKIGLPSSNGHMLVYDQKTGVLQTILMDEGYLTDIRTAIAGAICAKYLAPKTVEGIGIVGSGTQARLQLIYLTKTVDYKRIIIWGRSIEDLNTYKLDMEKEGITVEVTLDQAYLAQNCNLIVTTTPSTEPLIFAKNLLKGTHITAIGADTIGKQELDEAILEQADFIIVDSKKQCEAHGEIHKAINKNKLIDKKILELGTVIGQGGIKRDSNAITVADLTGIATQDIQISKYVLEHLKN